MKKIILTCLIFILCIPAIANATNIEVKIESPSKANLYKSYIVDTKDPNTDFVGKIVLYNDNVNVKHLVAEKIKKTNKSNISMNKEDQKKAQIIRDYFAKVASGSEEKFTEEFFEFLKQGSYVYFASPNEFEPQLQPMSAPQDISVNQPMVMLNSSTNNWEVVGGFHYTNDLAWKLDGIDSQQNRNIGGYDALGISLSGGTNSATLQNGSQLYAYYHQDPQTRNTCPTGFHKQYSFTSNGRDANIPSDKGALYKVQDKNILLSSSCNSNEQHNNFGAGAAYLIYSSQFSQAEGSAKTVFNHTWQTAQITEVKFGTTGVTITASPTNQQTGTIASADKAY